MWAQCINLLLGLWLMAAPSVLDYGGTARNSDHIVGPIIASLAAIAIWEATRGLRLVNLLSAAWLLLAPWLLSLEGAALVNSVAVGLAVAALSLAGGRVSESFGGGWSMLWRTS